MSREELYTASSETMSHNVNGRAALPTTWPGLIALAMFQWGPWAFALVAASIFYMDLRALNQKVLTAFTQQTAASVVAAQNTKDLTQIIAVEFAEAKAWRLKHD